MALQKSKRLHKIEMYTDADGALQRIQVVHMWHMKDDVTGDVDSDIGERPYVDEFELGDPLPADVEDAILERLGFENRLIPPS